MGRKVPSVPINDCNSKIKIAIGNGLRRSERSL